jgi:high-affinity nickel-transport protein
MLPKPFDDQPSQIKSKTAITYAFLIAANIAAWTWALISFVDRPVLLGTAFLAYMFGLRHAFDADHIAAIDNVVRKLMQDGKRPDTVGFWFSLGHSTVVVLACVAVAASTVAMQGRLSAVQQMASVFGTLISAAFLFAIAVANLVVLRKVWRDFLRVGHGDAAGLAALGTIPAGFAPLATLFGPVLKVITRSWQMYPLGVLFGLGFDTATEIGILGISAAQATQGMSPWQALVFPALFTVGMALIDTADSALMVNAYGWAFTNPLRKLTYNLMVTAASVAVALVIGGIEILALLESRLELRGAFWRLVARLNNSFSYLGFAVVAVFAVCWLGSVLVYHWSGDNRRGVAGTATE